MKPNDLHAVSDTIANLQAGTGDWNLLDSEFVAALLRSPTFLESVGLFASLALLCTCLAAGLLWKMTRTRRLGLIALHRESKGAAAALGFTLVAPFFMAIVFLILQFASLANGALMVHYAAYVAARTARVHAWVYPDDTPGSLLNLLIDAPIPNVAGQPFDTPQVAATRAARLALIAAAPAAPRIPKQSQGVPEAVYRAMAQAAPDFRGRSLADDRARVFVERARFAFDPRNARVEIVYPKYLLPDSYYEFQDRLGSTVSCESRHGCVELPVPYETGTPVTARVSFPLRLSFPIAARVWCAAEASKCEQRGDHYFRRATAEVTLL